MGPGVNAELERVARLRALAKKKDKVAVKELDSLFKNFAEGHIDSIYLDPSVLDVHSDFYIIDPLHCLELNLAKILYKYCFADKMVHSNLTCQVLEQYTCLELVSSSLAMCTFTCFLRGPGFVTSCSKMSS